MRTVTAEQRAQLLRTSYVPQVGRIRRIERLTELSKRGVPMQRIKRYAVEAWNRHYAALSYWGADTMTRSGSMARLYLIATKGEFASK